MVPATLSTFVLVVLYKSDKVFAHVPPHLCHCFVKSQMFILSETACSKCGIQNDFQYGCASISGSEVYSLNSHWFKI